MPSKMNGSFQKVVLTSICARAPYMAHYRVLDSHPGEARLFNTLQCEMYWPRMGNDTYISVDHCQACAAKSTTNHLEKELRLLLANGALKFVILNIFGPLLRTNSSNQHVLVFTERCKQLTRAIQITKKASTNVETVFCG